MSADLDREHEAVKAAFASLKADAAAQFPPPPVDKLIMRGPAALRRRRILSMATVVGACTALTAGGLAVASTLGPLVGGGDSAESGDSAEGSVSGEIPQDHTDEPTGDGGGDTETTTAPAPPADDIEALVVAGPFTGDWAADCGAGTQDADFESWTITGGTGWSIAFAGEGDADGDGDADTVLALTCGERTGVAAFAAAEGEDGEPVLATAAWVWQPDGAHEFTGVESVEDGTVVLEGTDTATGEAVTVEFAWDEGAYAPVEDETPTQTPTTDAATGTTPAETPTSDAATADTTGAGGS